MKKLIVIIILLIAHRSIAQNVLYGNGGYNIQTFKFSWLNSTDSIARIASYGYRIFKPLSLTTLSSGASVDTMLVWDYTDSTIKKRVVPSSGTSSLTSTYIGVGDGSNLLSGSSAYTYDGTTVLQENAAAAHILSSTTAVGSTAGGILSLATKPLPTGSGDQLGSINFISRNAGTDNLIGARIRAVAGGAWTATTTMPTDLVFATTGTSSATEKMRLTSGGNLGIGVSNPADRIQLAAGTSSVAPLRIPVGTLTTTIVQGRLEVDANANIFWSRASGAGNREQVLYADSVGAIPNGMIFQGNGTHVTGLALGSANQQLRVNAGATALEYYTPSGLFSPALTNTANISSSATFEGQWSRNGNSVTMSGQFTIDPTSATTLTQLTFTVPIASTLGAAENLSGVASDGTLSAKIYSNGSGSAILEFNSVGILATTWTYTLTYTIN